MENDKVVIIVIGVCLAISLGIIIFLFIRSRRVTNRFNLSPREIVTSFSRLNNGEKSMALREIVNEVDRLGNNAEKMENMIGKGGNDDDFYTRETPVPTMYSDNRSPEYGDPDEVQRDSNFRNTQEMRMKENEYFSDDRENEDQWERNEMGLSREPEDWERMEMMDRGNRNEMMDRGNKWGDGRNQNEEGWGRVTRNRNISNTLR